MAFVEFDGQDRVCHAVIPSFSGWTGMRHAAERWVESKEKGKGGR